jgi:2-desacetyl-2-hydroxyethyl bacteriochlorophyllide A dehydrogenase
MRLLTVPAPGRLGWVDVDEPAPAPHEVRVAVTHVGICGSDLEVLAGGRSAPCRLGYPVVGHEVTGVIDELGTGVRGLRVGDRVAAVHAWGAFSDSVLTTPEFVLRLDDRIAAEDAAVVEVLPGVAMAAWRTGITPGSHVLVVGQGLSGLLVTRLVRLHGCASLTVVEPVGSRLALAGDLGADHCVAGRVEECRDELSRICPTGFDVAVLATRSDVVDHVVQLVRCKGRIVVYGGLDPAARIDLMEIHRRSLSLVKESAGVAGAIEARELWAAAARLIGDGLLPVHLLRTHVLPFNRVEEAFRLRAEDPDALHVVCTHPWASRGDRG